MLKVSNCVKQIICIRSISISRALRNEDADNFNKVVKKPKRKVTETVELVQLVDQNDKILGLKPKKESQLLAKKLNLSLELVNDPKYGTAYPAYKMFAPSDLLRTEKKTTNARVLKKLPINSRISENDLGLKLKTVRKWLTKDCEVHIAIVSSGAGDTMMKSVFNKIKEEFTTDGRLLNIRNQENAIKFIIIPPKENSNKSTPSKKNDKKENIPAES